MDLKTAFVSTRPWSFTMTFSSITLGTLLAGLVGHFNVLLYLVTLGGSISFHAATNVLNDFYDVKHGVDRVGAPTTKYRLHPAAFGQAPMSSILRMSLGLYGLTLIAGIYLAVVSTPLILLLVGMGILGSTLYTADPIVLKARALGEPTVFVMWGLLMPLGAFMVQTDLFSWSPFVDAVPIGILVALVLLANNIRDIGYDGSVENRTIAVALGQARASKLYVTLLAVTYLYVILGIIVGFLPLWSAIVFATSPGALRLTRMFRGQVPDNADPRTAALAFQFSLLYMAAFVLQIVYHLTLAV